MVRNKISPGHHEGTAGHAVASHRPARVSHLPAPDPDSGLGNQTSAPCLYNKNVNPGEEWHVLNNDSARWFRKMAENGNSVAQEFLARAYEEGWPGFEKNDEQARYWHQQAMAKNFPSSHLKPTKPLTE